MPIRHYVTIKGQDYSPWTISINTDQQRERSDPDKVDLVLANPYGRFTGCWTKGDRVTIALENEVRCCNPAFRGSIAYSGKNSSGRTRTVTRTDRGWSEVLDAEEQSIGGQSWVTVTKQKYPLFCGHVVKVEYKESEAIIEARCGLSGLAETLPNGCPTFAPAIPKEIITWVIEEYNSNHGPDEQITIYHIDDFPQVKDQYTAKSDETYLDVLDHMQDMTSGIYHIRPDCSFEFVGPLTKRVTRNVGNLMTDPTVNRSVIGHRNIQTVVSSSDGMSTPGQHPAEREDNLPVIVEERNEDSIAEYGELIAPTYYLPYLVKEVDARALARNLLDWYKEYRDNATPELINTVIYLFEQIKYQVHNVPGRSGSGQCRKINPATGETDIIGWVLRVKIDYSASGWDVKLETSAPPKSAGSGGAAIPTSTEGLPEFAYDESTSNPFFVFMDEDRYNEIYGSLGVVLKEGEYIFYNPETGEMGNPAFGTLLFKPDGFYAMVPWNREKPSTVSDQLSAEERTEARFYQNSNLWYDRSGDVFGWSPVTSDAVYVQKDIYDAAAKAAGFNMYIDLPLGRTLYINPTSYQETGTIDAIKLDSGTSQPEGYYRALTWSRGVAPGDLEAQAFADSGGD